MIKCFANLGDSEAAEGFVVLSSDGYCFVPFMKPFVVLDGIVEFGIRDKTGLRKLVIGVLLVFGKGVRISIFGTMRDDSLSVSVG